MELGAWFFTVLTSLKIWKINQKLWLKGYFEACIANDRKAPEDLSRWLPWQMDENRLNELRIHDPPS